MANTKERYKINGLVQDESTHRAIPDLRVEAWDWDLPLMIDDFVGETTTDSEGRFRIEFDTARFRDFPAVAPLTQLKRLFPQRHPDIYFRIFRKGEAAPIKVTKDRILRNMRPGEHNVGVVLVDMTGTESPDVPDGPFSVEGTIAQHDQPLPGITVTAFDKDLRSEQLLGTRKTDEQGRYKIRYSADKFSRAEKSSADLFIRAHDKFNRLLGESEVRFNAGEAERIDLNVEPIEEVALSEYEIYLETLQPIVKDISLADLTEEDIDFLAGETQIDRSRLVRLQQSAQLSRATKVPAEVSYGLAVFGIGVDEAATLQLNLVLQQRLQSLREAIQRAAEIERLIPLRFAEPKNLDPILARLEQLQHEQGILKRYSVEGQLLLQRTKAPVANYMVHAFDRDVEEDRADLGYDFSDADGLFTVSYIAPPMPTGEAPSERRLRLEIANPQGEVVHTLEEVRARPAQETPVQVLLPQPAGPDEIDLTEVVSRVGVDLPEELASYLLRRNIRSLRDLRQAGGLAGLGELPLPPDHPAVRSLDAQANLSVLSTDFEQNQRLIANGFINLLTIARTPLGDFVSAVAEDIGEQKASLLHMRARAQDGYLTNILTRARADYANGLSPESGIDWGGIQQQYPGIAFVTCTCKDCESAVSPGAYLADLLSYALKHLRNEGVPITLHWLGDNFYQPFGDLPVSCESMETRVRQVRLCVEVLRRYLRQHPASKSLAAAERDYCLDAYKALLSQIGTSYDELRLAQTANAEERRELSDRLGVTSADSTDPAEHLKDLLLDPKATPTQQPNKALTESKLEALFGLVATKNTSGSLPDPLRDVKTPLVEEWRLAHLRQLWQQQDWPTDDVYASNGTLPVIDPDLIGPDDFRAPVPGAETATAPSTAFDLWLQRRRWVDQQLSELHAQQSPFGLQPMLESELGSPIPAWVSLENAGLLSYEGYSYLMTLLEKEQLAKAHPDENDDLGDSEWEEAISILTQARKATRRIAWIEEESSLQQDHLHHALFGPRQFWISQREPVEGVWPPVRLADQPWIDPDEAALDELPEPTFGQAAIGLWQNRREELDQHIRTLKEKHKEPDSFDAMLSYALELPPADMSEAALQKLREQLSSNDETVAEAAKTKVEGQFHMSAEDFLCLADLRGKDAAGKPLNRAEWEAVYAILISVIKRRAFPLWVEQEDIAQFYAEPWRALKARLPRWRASATDRQTWQQALRARSAAPVLDPDIITRRHLQVPYQGEAYALWRERGTWIENLLAVLAQASKDLIGLGTIVQDTLSPAGASATDPSVVTLDSIRTLWAEREAGGNIGPRLDQLTLTAAGLRQILRVVELLESDAHVLESEWDAVHSILLQVEKERWYTDWHFAEQQADITLRPSLFKLPEQTALQFPPPEPAPLPNWRATWRDQRAWEDKLQARIDQENTISGALKQAVSSTEEGTLPTLRDALIEAVNGGGYGFEKKGKWVTDHLLIDAKADGCNLTTRIAQAIQTIQLLVWSVRTDSLLDVRPALELDADDFEEEWKWIGSYESWRSAMFVFLYPENILLPSLHSHPTPAFRQFVDELRDNPRLTPESARQAAQRYADYFQDVCNLDIEATCQARTRFYGGICHEQGFSNDSYIFYMFGRGTATKTQVYWATYDPDDTSEYAQTFWAPVPGMSNVSRIVAAVPYVIEPKKRYVFVFALTGDGKLIFSRFDLEGGGGWESTVPSELPLPTEAWASGIVVVQNCNETTPPEFEVLWNSGSLYCRSLNETGDNWESDNWRHDSQARVSPASTNYAGAPINNPEREFTLHAVFAFSSPSGMTRAYIYTAWDSPTDFHLGLGWYGSSPFYYLLDSLYEENAHFIGAHQIGDNRVCLFYRDASGFVRQDTTSYSWAWHPLDVPQYLSKVVPFYGTPKKNESKIVFHDSIHKQHFYCDYFYYTGDTLNGSQRIGIQLKKQQAVTLSCDGPYEIRGACTEHSQTIMYFATRFAFIANKSSPAGLLVYLQEAYYFVAIETARQLQAAKAFDLALDWYRAVYNYSNPAISNRKIFYGLELEEQLDSRGQREHDWLLDPMDPHKIAATRANTYTRFTLQSIIRCLLDYADAEFTRDTADSIPKARTLYLTALELLALPEFQQTVVPCENLIADLGVEVGNAKQNDDVFGLQQALVQISDRSVLEAASKAVGEAFRQDRPWEEQVKESYRIISEARSTSPDIHLIADILDVSARITAQLQSAILTQPLLDRAVYAVAEATTGNLNSEVSLGDLRDAAARIPDYSLFAIPYSFCIPANPVMKALRLHAELNLYKLRSCCNIAGMKRQVEPYAASTDTATGMPIIGGERQLVVPGATRLQPTPYRYVVLIERAKQLVQLAQQMEAAMLGTLEKMDAESYQVLKARQEIELTRAGVRLQILRVTEAQSSVKLAELQRARSQLQLNHFKNLLASQTISGLEQVAVNYLNEAAGFYADLAEVSSTEWAGSVVGGAASWGSAAAATGNPYIIGGAAIAGALKGMFFGDAASERRTKQNKAALASTRSQIASIKLSQELTRREWSLQSNLAAQDILIGTQQITVAQDHVRVVGQEQEIAEMQADHAQGTLEFLSNKFTDVDLYDWMANILTSVYGFFLQQATAVAKLAENQLAFERQETPPAYIQADYWAVPAEDSLNGESGGPDRRGLTGSARLLQAVYQLDQYAFDTKQRKLQLTKVISLAKLDPYSFHRFRQTGTVTFVTSQQLFDRDFPGHYLRLIRQVRTSVIALIPPMQGIHATLSAAGISRVIIGPDIFQTTIVRRDPEQVALTAPSSATGLFELETQSDLLLPFEGMGVDTTWEFQLPKAANLFDYRTIADVIIAIDYTALNSFTYRQQVIQELDNSVSADQPFSFRNQFADQWYDLHNPDQTANPMVVRFETRREDFPPNIDDLTIEQVLLYLAGPAEGTNGDISLTLSFTSSDAHGKVGGGSRTDEGVISTRRSNGNPWLAMKGKSPVGRWELTFPDTPDVRELFEQERIEDILLVITYSGYTPEWPA